MSHIVFSTAEEHELEKYYSRPPRVTLRFDSAKQQWFIARSYRNLHFSKPNREQQVNSATPLAVQESYLVDLWRETRPDEALPESLATSE
jgi:hypothetical protein